MILRGRKTVLMSDVDCIWPRAWEHRYCGRESSNDRHSCIGPAEVQYIVANYVLVCNIGTGKIWKSPPHITADNYFLSDSILDWIGKQGLGMMGTVAKNRLPAKVPGKYFQKKNDAAGDLNSKQRAKMSGPAKPITAVKTVQADPDKGTKAYR